MVVVGIRRVHKCIPEMHLQRRNRQETGGLWQTEPTRGIDVNYYQICSYGQTFARIPLLSIDSL
jgi:hypothetical protein